MSAVQSHVAFILDGLAKKAVAEIIKLFDNTFSAFIEELCKKQNEIDQLKKMLESSPSYVYTEGSIVQEKHSALDLEEDISVSFQTSNNEEDSERKFSPPVTQWDFPDEQHEQQYEFEGISDDGQALLRIDGEVDDESAESCENPECSASEGGGEFGLQEFEAAEMGTLTEEVQSGAQRAPSSDSNNDEHSPIPVKKKVGRPRKVPRIATAEIPETPQTETEAERIPALENKRKRKGRKVRNTMTCSECKQIFYRPKDFIRHRFSHKQKPLLACEWCGMTFPFQSQMVNHVRIHTGERPFSCDVCDKTFISKGHLRTHMWFHKPKGKNKSCSLCGVGSSELLDGYTPRRRSTRPCAKCGKAKSVT